MHNAIMAEKSPFLIWIEPDPLHPLWFRWTICEGEQVVMRSPRAYAARAEAEDEANQMLARLNTQRSMK
jgi:hypothetical protein